MAVARAPPRAEVVQRVRSASDAPGADIESFEEYVARRRGRGSRSDRTDEASTSASAPRGAPVGSCPVSASSGRARQAAPCQHPARVRPRAAPAQALPDTLAPWQPSRALDSTCAAHEALRKGGSAHPDPGTSRRQRRARHRRVARPRPGARSAELAARADGGDAQDHDRHARRPAPLPDAVRDVRGPELRPARPARARWPPARAAAAGRRHGGRQEHCARDHRLRRLLEQGTLRARPACATRKT